MPDYSGGAREFSPEEFDALAKKIPELAKEVGDLRDQLGRLGFTIRATKGFSTELITAFGQLGIEVRTLSEEHIVEMEKKFNEAAKVVEEVYGRKVPAEVKQALDKAQRELLQYGSGLENQMKRAGIAIKDLGRSTTKDVGAAVQGEISKFVPPALQRFGIWGALIGLAIGADQWMRPTAARILANWRRATGGIEGDLEGMQKHVQAFASQWEFLSEQQITAIWSPVGDMLDEFKNKSGAVTAELKNMVNETTELDMRMGTQYGATLQRLASQHVRFGTSVKGSWKEMTGLTNLFAGAGFTGINMWSQAVFDLQSRLGPLGQDVGMLSRTLASLGQVSEGLGGGLQQAQAAMQQLGGVFQRVGLPWQIMMGAALPGMEGAPEIQQMLAYQRMMVFGRIGTGKERQTFGEQMPRMFTAMLKEARVFEAPAGERELIMQQVLGLPRELSIILGKVMEEEGEAGFEEALSSPAMRKHIEDSTKDLKDIVREELPLWTRLLKTLVRLVLNGINMIMEGLNALLAVGLAALDPSVSVRQVIGVVSEPLLQRQRTMEALFKSLGEDIAEGVAVGTIPGLWDLFKGEEMKPPGAGLTPQQRDILLGLIGTGRDPEFAREVSARGGITPELFQDVIEDIQYVQEDDTYIIQVGTITKKIKKSEKQKEFAEIKAYLGKHSAASVEGAGG